MIDLRNNSLSNTILVNGRLFSIYTDFRVWLKFGEVIKNKKATSQDLVFVFKNDIPNCNFVQELFDFYINENITPKIDGASDVKTFDYILDGEYIYGSFMQQYGIDLIEIEELHWHKFKALFLCLGEKTKQSQIMSYRAYKKTTKKMETQYEELCKYWALPIEMTDEDKELLDWFDNL